MRIDPITGEIINDEHENEKQELINAEDVSQVSGGFDPMTGEPIEEVQQNQVSGGFDPMTGEPIEEAQQNQVSGGFDPMTGEPIEEAQQNQVSGGFDPMTGKPLKAAKPAKKKMLIPIVAVIAVAAIVALVINSGLFLGPFGKIQKAVVRTLKEKPHIVEDLQGLEMLTKDEFTLTAKATMGDESVEAEFRSKAEEKQIYGELNMDGFDELSILAGIDKSKVKILIPEVDKRVFVYDSKGKNNGYIVEEKEEDDIDALNAIIESINSGDYNQKKFNKEIINVIEKEFESLTYEKAKKAKYRVDGDKRKCSGYKTELTEDNMVNIIDGVEKVYKKYYSEEMLEILEEQGESIEDMFEEMRADVKDMEDIELSFYIYKNKIACIKMEYTETDNVIEIAFQGGDYRLQNIKMTTESEWGERTFEIKGSVSGSKEKLKFIENGNKDGALEIEYDYKSGNFSIQRDSYKNIDIEGNLKPSKSKLVVTIDWFSYGNTSLSGAKLELTLSKHAKMSKYKGKEFDLGNASEDEWEDMKEDFEDAWDDYDMDELLNYF